MSNRQQKRIKLQQQKAMQSIAATCSSQKWQWLSFLKEEVVQHAVTVRPHCHSSVDFLALSGGKKLFKLNHGHYEKLCLLVAVSWGGSVDKDLHQCMGAGGAVPVSQSVFHKLVYCMLSRYHLVLGHGFQMALGKQVFSVLLVLFDIWFECFASPLNCTYGAYALRCTTYQALFGHHFLPLPLGFALRQQE